MSSSFTNNIGPLNTYFTSTATDIASLTANTAGNLYSNVSTQLTCDTTNLAITCPNTADTGCTASFINNFCFSNGTIGYINISN